jgi:hypothetical protein
LQCLGKQVKATQRFTFTIHRNPCPSPLLTNLPREYIPSKPHQLLLNHTQHLVKFNTFNIRPRRYEPTPFSPPPVRLARCALIQANFNKTWKGESSEQCLTDIRILREEFPSYFTITLDAIKRLSSNEVGRLFAVIRCCAVMLYLFLIQSLSPEQTSEYCADLWDYVVDGCPGALARGFHMVELSALLQRMMNEEYGPPGTMGRTLAIAQDFFSGEADHFTGKSNYFHSTMTQRVTFAIIGAQCPLFRERMSSFQYLNVGRGFRREELVRDKPFPFYGIDFFDDDDDADMEEAELAPTGEPVPLADFCEPTTVVPEGEECPICTASVKDEGEDAVVTKCLHFFHQECLNKWVNELCRMRRMHAPPVAQRCVDSASGTLSMARRLTHPQKRVRRRSLRQSEGYGM